jgi:BMFP domain-containing protein YqiC
MFHGTAWSDSPLIAEKMFNAFTRLCALHELMALLSIARQRIVEKDIQTLLAARLNDIEVICREESENPGRADVAGIKRATLEALRGLESTSAVAALKS